MEALHLLFAGNAHHVAAEIHETGIAEVMLVEEGDDAAAVVTAVRGCPMLAAGPSAAVVMPAALARMLPGHGCHLLHEENLVQIMHLLVGKAVMIFPGRVFVDGAGRIQLESVHSHVHEIGQMVGPVLQPGLGAPFALGDEVLFDDAVVVFLAEPEPEMDTHAAEFADEQTGIELLGHLVLQPVRLRGELVVVPAFLRREIVAFFHPLRLEPEEVDGHSHLTEVRGVAEDGPLVLTHVGAEGESVGPLGKNVGTSSDLRIKIQHGRHVGTRHQIEIGGAGRIVDVEPVGIGETHIEVALSGGVVEHSPSARTHHERHWDFRMLVGSPHAQHLAPVLYVLAGGASSAIEAFAVFHAEADDACGSGISCLGHVALVLRIVVITDYTIVFCHHEAAELVDHGFGKRLDFRTATLVEHYLTDYGITLGVLQADGPLRLVDDDAGRCSAHRKEVAFVFYRFSN